MTEKTPEYWMKLALDEAKRAESLDEIPIGAVLVDLETNTLITKAHNITQMTQNSLNHAEKVCLEHAMTLRGEKVLPNTALYTTLEPCPLCATAISFSRIKKCYFAAGDPKAGAVIHHTKLPTMHPHFFKTEYIQLKGSIEQDSIQLLKNFFQKQRKHS
ncbi:MAG: nucleoside deaminase [Alphaproteobacteria bacterium]|nr:nucleoside deaminase [Alphaproteobacteria bacterium]